MEPLFDLDSSCWDNTETVLYISKTAEVPQPTGVSVSGVYFEQLDKSMGPAGAPMSTQERQVQLPGRILAGLDTPIVPKANDIIQRCDGTRWSVKRIHEPVGVDWQVDVVLGNK